MDAHQRVPIGGTASNDLKQSLLGFITQLDKSKGFEPEITSRVEWTELSIMSKVEVPERPEGRVVGEITVTEDMLNGHGTVHGACSALLIDNCSTMPIALLTLATTGQCDFGVSQSLNILYHAPAMVDDRLRIVSNTISLGSRTLSSRCEIWNITRHRLVASGTHVKMATSLPKIPTKL